MFLLKGLIANRGTRVQVFWEEASSQPSAYLRLRHPPQRAFPARNAHPVKVRFAIKNSERAVR
jgi:hypothetical protein